MQEGLGDDLLLVATEGEVVRDKVMGEGDAFFAHVAATEAAQGAIPAEAPVGEVEFLEP